MPNLQTLSGPKLEQLIETRSDATSKLLMKVIEAGHGNDTMNDLRASVKEGSASDLVQAYMAAYDEEILARDELDARRRYHGSDKPSRRP